MVGHPLRALYVQQRPRRAIARSGVALVLLGLAWLTSGQVERWQTDERLWTAAAQIAPHAPRPLVNLAVQKIVQGDLEGAERLLGRASALADHQRRLDDRDWSHDVIDANLAVIRIRQGRLGEALQLAQPGPPWSTRWLLCRQWPVCAGHEP